MITFESVTVQGLLCCSQAAMDPALFYLVRSFRTFWDNNVRFMMPCSVLNAAFVSTRDAICCDVLYVTGGSTSCTPFARVGPSRDLFVSPLVLCRLW